MKNVHLIIQCCTFNILFIVIFSFLFPCIAISQQFSRVKNGPVVSDGGASQGVSWIDYDNDGYLDIYITNMLYPSGHINFLYRNLGDGSFQRVLTGEICTDQGASRACTWGDFDNDGDPDLFVTNLGSHFNAFYQNNGDGSFKKVTSSILTKDNSTSTSASWCDYNNDGFIDLIVANYGKNFLYRNDDSTFTKMIEGPVVTDETTSYLSLWGDYNNDGNFDLFVANNSDNSPLPNNLYQNNGDGSFSSTQGNPVVSDHSEMSYGGSWGDYDNDGYIDLFVTNISYQSPGNNCLYHNDGDGSFSRITHGNIVNDGGYSFGSAWGDFDNDGDLDLAVANFDVGAGGVNFLYSNNGDGTFTRLTDEEIATDNFSSVGLAWGDYDRDGDLDLLVANSGNDNENNTIYRNNGNSNNWINIKLIGTQSNKSAIGSKIRLKAVINNKSIWQLREIAALTGYCSQNSLNAHFGLGDAVKTDSVKIEWPSGLVEILTDIGVNQFLIITEGEATGISDHDACHTTPKKFILFQNYPNPFNIATTIQFNLPYPSPVSLKIYNIQGKQIRSLADEQIYGAGSQSIFWDSKDDLGTKVSSGQYFYRLQIEEIIETKKMILLK